MAELTQLEKLRASAGHPLLRPMATAPIIRPGTDDPIVRMHDCPDCNGQGWLYENPFAEYGKVLRQCPTCIAAKRHFDAHGELPEDIGAGVAEVIAHKALVARCLALVKSGKRVKAVRDYRKATGCTLAVAHQALNL